MSRKGRNNGMYGKHHTLESKEKISRTKKEYYKTHKSLLLGRSNPNMSEYMKLHNPMKDKKIASKVRESNFKNGHYQKISERMKIDNPMFNPDIAKYNNPMFNPDSVKKMIETKKQNGDNEKASKRMKENNPMKNPFIASKVAKTQRENGHYDRLRKQLLGKPRSEETKKKMSNSLKGRKAWNKGKKGVQIGWLKGKHPSSEAIRKMIETRMKNNSYYHSEKTRKKMSLSSFGKPKSEEHRKAIKEARKKRIMPKIDTSIEVKIQNFLKQLGISFLTHQYIEQIEHGYQCDILIPSLNLVIECDGDYWHKYPIGKELDSVRTSELLQKGFKVLRLWEHEIKKMNIDEFKFKLEDKK